MQHSGFTGLMLILPLSDGLEPLLSTGASKDVPSLHRRYVDTIIHVNNWYDYDIFDPSTKGYKSIRQVRAMHRRVQKIMNEKFRVPDEKGGYGRKWFNYYDVCITQFAFVGPAMLWPHKTGLIGASEDELESLNYYWRVLGYLLGLKDEYNCCQFDKYADIRRFMEIVFKKGFLDSYHETESKIGLEMDKGIALALHDYLPTMTFNTLAYWWKDCFEFPGYEIKPLSARERFMHLTTSLSFNHLCKYEGVLKFMVKLHRARLEAKIKTREKIQKRLDKEYKDKKNYTYISSRMDYFGDKDNNSAPQASTGVCPLGYGRIASSSATPQEITVSS